MKLGWQVNTSFFKGMAIAWLAVGLLVVFVVALVWRSYDRRSHDVGPAWVHSPLHLVLPIWLGPIVLAAAVVAMYGLGLGVRELWRHPPIRRVTKPIATDLREHARRGSTDE